MQTIDPMEIGCSGSSAVAVEQKEGDLAAET